MHRALLFAIGFCLMAAFWPGVAGVATMPRWDIGVLIALALFVAPPRRIGAIDAFGLALIAWLAVSIAWSSAPLDGADSAIRMVVVAVVFAWGATLEDLRPLIAGAAVGLIPSSAIAIAQWVGFHPVESYGAIGGLFYNGDRLAGAAALVLGAVIGLRMWWALPALVPVLILPLSRAAWLAAGVVVLVEVWRTGKTFERFVTVVMLGWLAGLALMLAPVWHWTSLDERLAIWSWTVAHLDWLGHGLGSFAANPLVLASAVGPTHPEHPHSEWLWLAYEGGAVGCGLGIAFAVALGRCLSRGPGELVFIALGVLACFAMPFHDPGTVLLAAIVAGHAARSRRDLRAPSDARGDPLRQGLSAASAR